MSAELDSSNWSGEGDFTRRLIDWCASQPAVAFVRVEDDLRITGVRLATTKPKRPMPGYEHEPGRASLVGTGCWSPRWNLMRDVVAPS